MFMNIMRSRSTIENSDSDDNSDESNEIAERTADCPSAPIDKEQSSSHSGAATAVHSRTGSNDSSSNYKQSSRVISTQRQHSASKSSRSQSASPLSPVAVRRFFSGIGSGGRRRNLGSQNNNSSRIEGSNVGNNLVSGGKNTNTTNMEKNADSLAVSQGPSGSMTPERTKKSITRMIIIKYYEDCDQNAKIIPRTLAFFVKKRIKPLLDLLPSGNEDRKRSLIKHHLRECRALMGRELIELIMNDDQWLQKHNPIHQVLLYNEEENKFEQVLHDKMFPIFQFDKQGRKSLSLDRKSQYGSGNNSRSRRTRSYSEHDKSPTKVFKRSESSLIDSSSSSSSSGGGNGSPLPANIRAEKNRLEHVFVFHVKRRWAVESVIVQSTMSFSHSQAAEDWVASVYQNTQMMPENDEEAAASVRYLDVHHNGYTRIYKDQRLPLERTGRTMVKIMLEKRQSQSLLEQLRVQYEEMKRTSSGMSKSKTMVFEKPSDDFYMSYDDDESEMANMDTDELSSDDEEELHDDFGEGYMLPATGSLEDRRNALLHAGYSSFVDFAKLPSDLMSTPEAFERERQRVARWKKARMPKRHVEVTTKTKKLVRLGVPETQRRTYWLGVTGAGELLRTSPNFYLADFANTYGTYRPHNPEDEVTVESIQPRMFANFGGQLDTESEYYYLTQEGTIAAKRILCVLNDRNVDIDFCPMIPSIVSMLLTHMDEAETYAALHHMISVTRRVRWFFRLNKMDHLLFVESFKDLISKKLPDVANHMEDIDFDLNALAHAWFNRMFISYLPFAYTIRLMDSFLNEGCKILFRVGYATLLYLKPHILQCKSPNFLSKTIFEKTRELNNEDQFFKTAFGFPLKRKQMKQLEDRNRSKIDIAKFSQAQMSTFVKPKFCDGHTSEIIGNMSQWELIVSWLPTMQRVRKMQKIFTTSKHGFSLTSLYEKCSDSGACIVLIHAYPNLSEDDPDNIKYWQEQGDSRLMVGSSSNSGGSGGAADNEDEEDIVDLIKTKKAQGIPLRKQILEEEETKRKLEKLRSPIPDKKGVEKKSIFGAYVGDTIDMTYRYEGTTDSFLFSLYPVEACYKWTRKNDYFVMGRHDRLVFGGGGDGPGLQFDDMLESGASYKSLTFENEPLCGTSVTFTILKLEVWSFR